MCLQIITMLTMIRSAWCEIHQRECSIASQAAFSNMAGTPCTAYSYAGLMDEETAESFAHLLAWAGQRRKVQEPVIVQECTEKFDRTALEKLLPMYTWSYALLNPESFGFPVRRIRQWCVCLCFRIHHILLCFLLSLHAK